MLRPFANVGGDVNYRRRNEAPLEIAVFVSDNPRQNLEQKLLIRVQIVMVNTQVSLRIKSSSFSYLILYTKGYTSFHFYLNLSKKWKKFKFETVFYVYIHVYSFDVFNQHTQECYDIGYKLELIIQMLLFTQNHKIYIVHAYHCVAISIANILFTNAAIPPTFRFFAFF